MTNPLVLVVQSSWTSIDIFVSSLRSIAKELADWLINNNVVEHIFGPNLHIEVSRLLHGQTPLVFIVFVVWFRDDFFVEHVVLSNRSLKIYCF